MKKTKILLLDGQNINTLAMTRELGRNGYHVGVTCMNRYGLTLFSKYASDRFLVPDYQSRQKYVKAIARIAIDNDYSVVIPIGLESYLAFSEFRNLVPDTIMVLQRSRWILHRARILLLSMHTILDFVFQRP